LHGTEIEGRLIESIVPRRLAKSPGTAIIVGLILLYYVLMLVLAVPADPGALFGFSSFSLQQLGATHGTRILRGENWRFLTSIFGHHDLLHLAFNLWALSDAGPLVEEIFDRKKMLVIYFVSGVASMVVSFVWYVYFREDVAYVSAGASGAVSGLIGAALFGARRMGPSGAEVAKAMLRWALYLLVWGFMMRGVNNAAHFGGFVVASLMALVIPLGLTKSVLANRGLSVVVLGLTLSVVVATGFMLAAAKGFPASLSHDAEPRSILGFRYSSGASDVESDQRAIWETCKSKVEVPDCELNVRVNDQQPGAYLLLANAFDHSGEGRQAELLRRIAARMYREHPGQ
jgi:rhomboid protease GluP